MKAYNAYGKEPYQVVLVHGGPGAAGEMTEVAKRLSSECSVIEPFQRAYSVKGQVEELREIISKTCTLPITIIGYSWGAMLTILVAAENPELFKKIILVSCPPFEGDMAPVIIQTRIDRLNEEERAQFSQVKKRLSFASGEEKALLFLEIKKLFNKADEFNPDPVEKSLQHVDFQLDIYESVWAEAAILRQEGLFFESLQKVHVPVVFIHGEYDPHPLDAVWKNANALKQAEVVVLKHCGHTPWIEKEAKSVFYHALSKEL